MNVPIEYFKISKPSEKKVPEAEIDSTYKKYRNRTFWGAAATYCLYYLCRMVLSVVKQPIIDDGVLSASELGLIGSTLLFAYAFGKFANGFIADYCNIRRFMAWGIFISAILNLLMGFLGLLYGWLGFTSLIVFISFLILWALNGWTQSMGAPPGVISLSRWFPLSKRGTFFSIFCATPYIGKFLSLVITGHIVVWIGWQFGFIVAAIGGIIGAVVAFVFVSDTPESKGLPSVQELSGEEITKTETTEIHKLQKAVLLHPGIWVIALSSAFVYITQYGLSNWGVLFLQKGKAFSLGEATWVIGFAEALGVAGTVLAGWLSDSVFKGNRIKPVIICGIICSLSLIVFLFTKGGFILNFFYIALFSIAIGVLYCIVGGLMALDVVPRKATGAALGIVGISSYLAAGFQDIISGFLIQDNQTLSQISHSANYDFVPVALFWIVSCVISFLLPLIFWKALKRPVNI